MGKAILPVMLPLLEQMFQLPTGYKITASHQETGSPIVNFLIESEHIPANEIEGMSLPEMDLHVQMVQHPFDPDFRRLIVNPKLRST